MTQSTVALILGLIPVADKLIFEVGSRLIELDTRDLSRDDLVKAIAASKSENWPALKFQSPRKD